MTPPPGEAEESPAEDGSRNSSHRRSHRLWLPLLWLLAAPAPVRTGADRILQRPYLDWILGRRVGLITNQTGVNANLQSTIERLRQHPNITLVTIFSPEHGLDGGRQAGTRIQGQGQEVSLYGERRAPSAAMLRKLDVLLYDLQDTGTRYYTYISTLYYSLTAAARAGIPLIVLDRPDPLGGKQVQGPVLEQGFRSFVGVFPLPVRYGMTPGELSLLMNSRERLGADLKVVPLEGWERRLWYDQTGLSWIAPSPNMPTLATATVYAGFCLIEGTNLSEGRGTTRPFELVGAPWLQSRELARRLNQIQLPGVRFRPQSFTPTFSKFSNRLCRGVQVHVMDRNRFRPLLATLHLIAQARRLHPDRFQFLPGFDHLAGNSWIRKRLQKGESPDRIAAAWQQALQEFQRLRLPFLLYP